LSGALASFYNPGGLAMTLSASISASLNLYGVERRKVDGGFVSYISGERQEADLEATAFPTIPNTFGIMRAFGEKFPDGSRRHALAFSMLIPDQTNISYDVTLGRSGEIDVVGGTISVGYNFASFGINVGFLGSVGWGTAQALNLAGDPTYLERDALYDSYYFFISGAQRIVAETLEDLIESAPEEPPAADAGE
jgi:hypothetical protein